MRARPVSVFGGMASNHWVVDWGDGQPDRVEVGAERLEVERHMPPSVAAVELKIYREGKERDGFAVQISDAGFIELDVRGNSRLTSLFCKGNRNSLLALDERKN